MRATQRQDVNESGAIAQLGERNTGSVEVSGSIPLSSTKHHRTVLVQSALQNEEEN